MRQDEAYKKSKKTRSGSHNPVSYLSHIEKRLEVFLKKNKIELHKSRLLKTTKAKKSKLKREGRLIIKLNPKKQALRLASPSPDQYEHK
jgi:hypothetical protein